VPRTSSGRCEGVDAEGVWTLTRTCSRQALTLPAAVCRCHCAQLCTTMTPALPACSVCVCAVLCCSTAAGEGRGHAPAAGARVRPPLDPRQRRPRSAGAGHVCGAALGHERCCCCSSCAGGWWG
jgi:hypothetical protein